MVWHAARLVRDGELGAIRFVAVEHASGWAATPLGSPVTSRPAGARTREIAGETSVVGDLGTHAFQLLRYVTGLDRHPRLRRAEHPGAGTARVRQRRRFG